MSLCPCCSGIDFAQCCGPVLSGEKVAASAEALMRARYTAYTRGDIDFVMNSTLPASRSDSDIAAMKEWADQAEWTGLEIVSTKAGGESDNRGDVEFIARYNLQGIAQLHHERSVFSKLDGQWYFQDGKVVASGPAEKPMPVVNLNKIGRNDPCSCGSGKKFKKCCGA